MSATRSASEEAKGISGESGRASQQKVPSLRPSAQPFFSFSFPLGFSPSTFGFRAVPTEWGGEEAATGLE